MNHASLYVFLADFNSKTTKDDNLMVSGKCGFKFSDRKIEHTEFISFQAFGDTAQSLIDSGINSSHIVNGRLNVYKPEEPALNPRLNLIVESAICLTPGIIEDTEDEDTQEEDNEPEDDSTNDTSNVTTSSIPTDKPDSTSTPTNKAELTTVESSDKANLDKIPF